MIYRMIGGSNPRGRERRETVQWTVEQKACQAACEIGRADFPARAPSGAKQRDPPTPILKIFSRERVLNFFVKGLQPKEYFQV